MKVLIEADGGVIARYDKGVTLLHHAAYYAQVSCVSSRDGIWLVLTFYPLPGGVSSLSVGQMEREEISGGRYVFGIPLAKVSNGSCLLFAYLITDLKDDAGATPAHIAARNGSLPCLKAMVEAQINMTQEDMNGQTPVDWANGANQKMCAHYLLLVDSCQTLSATVSKLQGQITRSVRSFVSSCIRLHCATFRSREENQYLKAQLTEASRSKEMMEQELREEYDESVEEVCRSHVVSAFKWTLSLSSG